MKIVSGTMVNLDQEELRFEASSDTSVGTAILLKAYAGARDDLALWISPTNARKLIIELEKISAMEPTDAPTNI